MHRRTSCLLGLLFVPLLACAPATGTPDPGKVGGPCYPNGTCDPGLECDQGVCQEPEGCLAQSTQPCTCADQTAGVQTCGAGGAWGACVCTQCGNGLREGDEVCDGAALGPHSCPTAAGLPFGTLTCTASCELDTSSCHGCGNDTLNPGEVCDGQALGGQTCATQTGESQGVLACLVGCQGFDTSNCGGGSSCGDDVVDTGEQCDGPDLNGQSCVGLGYASGNLACSASCTYDESGCTTASLAQMLELCSVDGDCDTGLHCREMTTGGFSRCTPGCVSDAQCPSGTRCEDDGSGSTYCLGNDVGRYCAQATDCNFACLTANTYCTIPCVDGYGCPNGYGCMPVGNPAQNVCVRVEAWCDASDTSGCIVPAACDTSANLIVGGCTIACNSAAECPQRALPQIPWTCDGLCRRPGDVYGPLAGGYTPVEYYCDAQSQPINLCNDAQHMDFTQFTVPNPPAVDCQAAYTTPGVAGDACVNSCRDQGGCPHGFACVSLGQVSGQRIGLCLPTGNVETGAVCANHIQCVSGYCYSGICSRDCTFDGLCPGGLTCTAGGAPDVEGQTFRRCQ